MEKSRLEQIIHDVRNGIGAALCLAAVSSTIEGVYAFETFVGEASKPNCLYSEKCYQNLIDGITEMGLGIVLGCVGYLAAPPGKKKKENQ
jgi:hypothetical protein